MKQQILQYSQKTKQLKPHKPNSPNLAFLNTTSRQALKKHKPNKNLAKTHLTLKLNNTELPTSAPFLKALQTSSPNPNKKSPSHKTSAFTLSPKHKHKKIPESAKCKTCTHMFPQSPSHKKKRKTNIGLEEELEMLTREVEKTRAKMIRKERKRRDSTPEDPESCLHKAVKKVREERNALSQNTGGCIGRRGYRGSIVRNMNKQNNVSSHPHNALSKNNNTQHLQLPGASVLNGENKEKEKDGLQTQSSLRDVNRTNQYSLITGRDKLDINFIKNNCSRAEDLGFIDMKFEKEFQIAAEKASILKRI